MEAYPRTILELEDRFPDEEACRDYLGQLRWPNGFVCPRCQAKEAWSATRGRLVCRTCRHQTSVTAGTIFQDTHKPLRLWFRAIWQITSQKTGASAVAVQQVLGLGSYLTAWTWLHKLRRAMVRPGRELLRGRVEVDETQVGAEEDDNAEKTAESRVLVVIAAEEDGRGIGRIRMARIPAASRAALYAFIQRTIEIGSVVHTDGLMAYRGLKRLGYEHEISVLQGRGKEAAGKLLPRVHRVASLLKRWLLGTHQGAVSSKHLDYYLDEFTFRFNRRTSRSRGKLFYRLLQQAVQVGPAPYHTIIASHDPDPANHNL
jgi:transposase-like protein/ribosomal protein L40E